MLNKQFRLKMAPSLAYALGFVQVMHACVCECMYVFIVFMIVVLNEQFRLKMAPSLAYALGFVQVVHVCGCMCLCMCMRDVGLASDKCTLVATYIHIHTHTHTHRHTHRHPAAGSHPLQSKTSA